MLVVSLAVANPAPDLRSSGTVRLGIV